MPKRPIDRRASNLEGVLSVNPRGFGFVASLDAGAGRDVFVASENLGGAMHGDKVSVRVDRHGARGPEGQIVGIVERGSSRVAGTLHRRGQSAWVEPDDARVRGPIVLTRSADAAGPEGNSGSDGDAVVVSIVRWPESPDQTPEGRIETVLGRPGELSVEAAKILVMERVQEHHSDAAIAEAEAYGFEVPEPMKRDREDLRGLPLPTIDPEDARDHDDAVWVERIERGGFRAWIAIADVSTYVSMGSALDVEASSRGCSIYLPERAIPMLPRALSSNLCSLLPDVDRLCLCVVAELDSHGSVTAARLVRGVMRSRAKLTYGGVARALGLSDAVPRQPAAEDMIEGLRVAYDLSRLLRAQRMKRGALNFELPEARVVLDAETREPVDVRKRTQDPGVKRAYQLVEELMLLANETVARWCIERGVPAIYRVHAPPDEQKLERFAAMCDALGISFDVEDTRDPKKLGEFLRSFADHPLAPALNSLLLRSMKQATYDVNNTGHFGLASPAYLHFTSPIRRYPDLVVHRIVHAALSGRLSQQTALSGMRLAEAALASSLAERRAMEVERATVDLYRTFLMKDRIGDRYVGTVTAVVGSGVFVQIDEPFVDVLVRLEDLGPDHWQVDDDTLRVVAGRSGDVVGLGDEVPVEIVDTSILRRTTYARRIAQSQGRDKTGTRPVPAPRRTAKLRANVRSASPKHERGPGGSSRSKPGRKPVAPAGGRKQGNQGQRSKKGRKR